MLVAQLPVSFCFFPICFSFGILQQPSLLTLVFAEAMNVMSMIRAAGRARDVPRALELLRQLELSVKHLGMVSDGQVSFDILLIWTSSMKS